MNPFEWSGPAFLGFFLLWSIALLVTAAVFRGKSEGGQPDLAMKGPYLLAYLRGGRHAAVQVCVLALLERRILRAEGTMLHPATEATRPPGGDLEEAIFAAASGTDGGVDTRHLVEDRTVGHALDRIEQRLLQKGMLVSPDQRTRRWIAGGILCSALWGVAGTKILIGVSRHRPVALLVVLAITATFGLAAIILRKRTARGDRQLKQFREICAHLKDPVNVEARVFQGDGADLPLAAALFGVAVVPAMLHPDVMGLFRGTDLTGGYPGASGSGATGCGSSCGSGCGSGCGGGGGCGGCSS